MRSLQIFNLGLNLLSYNNIYASLVSKNELTYRRYLTDFVFLFFSTNISNSNQRELFSWFFYVKNSLRTLIIDNLSEHESDAIIKQLHQIKHLRHLMLLLRGIWSKKHLGCFRKNKNKANEFFLRIGRY